MLECVVNISEGRREDVLDAVAGAGGPCLLDVHVDPHHNRAVLTLAGDGVEEAVRAVTAEAVGRIDLREHEGVHPRLGAVDVVPFVPLADATLADAVAARGRFIAWAAAELGLPCFLYGPERPLPEVRKRAFVDLSPDAGPPSPHPSAGAVCAGARSLLVAYNVRLARGCTPAEARAVAAGVRGPAVRALGFDVGGRGQVSMNLVDPSVVGPADAYDAVAALVPVEGAELVGLVPAAVLDAVAPERWDDLDLGADRTIEARLAAVSDGRAAHP